MNDLEQSITRVIESYASAVYERDVDAFMRLYDPKVRVFDAWDVWEYEDSAKWRRPIETWLNAPGTERVKVTFEDVQTSGSRECAIVSAIVTYARVSAQGERLHAMQNRLTWALVASGHAFRVVHEHTSVPVDFEETKPILKRKSGS